MPNIRLWPRKASLISATVCGSLLDSEETFYIDLGSTFDTLNSGRRQLTLAQDQNDTQNAAIDDGFEGLNVTTIAIEIPKSLFPNRPSVCTPQRADRKTESS
jgi:hypothetical protein